jgi:hypothetical protein
LLQADTSEKYTKALRVARSSRPAPFENIGCCEVIEEVASAVREWFDEGGVPTLLAKLEELRESMWSRSAHYDVFSGHGALMAVEEACTPLLFRVRLAGVWSEPLLPETERWQIRLVVGGLEEVLGKVVAEEHRG